MAQKLLLYFINNKILENGKIKRYKDQTNEKLKQDCYYSKVKIIIRYFIFDEDHLWFAYK